MHLRQFCLLVTLAFIAWCTTFASAEDLVHDKSLKTNSQRKLTDGSRRNLKESIDEVADDERGLQSYMRINLPEGQTRLEIAVDDLKALTGNQQIKQSRHMNLWPKLKALLHHKKKPSKRRDETEMEPLLGHQKLSLSHETKLAKVQPVLDHQQPIQRLDEKEVAKVHPMLGHQKPLQSRDETELAKVQPMLDDQKLIQELYETKVAKLLDDPTIIESWDEKKLEHELNLIKDEIYYQNGDYQDTLSNLEYYDGLSDIFLARTNELTVEDKVTNIMKDKSKKGELKTGVKDFMTTNKIANTYKEQADGYHEKAKKIDKLVKNMKTVRDNIQIQLAKKKPSFEPDTKEN